MDPLAHTLVGASLAETSLRRRSAMAAPTRRQVDDEIDVSGETRIAVQHRCEPTNNHVARAGVVERAKDRLEERHSAIIGTGKV